MYITKKKQIQNDTRLVVAMTTVMPLACVFIKTKIPRFYLRQGSSTPNNLLKIVKTI